MSKKKDKTSALQGGGLDKGLKLAKGDESSPVENDKPKRYIPPLETQHDQVIREEQEAVKAVMQAQADKQDSQLNSVDDGDQKERKSCD